MLEKQTKWYTYSTDEETGRVLPSVTDFDSLPYEEKAIWYRPFCTEEEITRILNIRTAEDYLLRLAADDIADNSRQLRSCVFLRRLNKEEWSLSAYLHSECFNVYKKALSPEDLQTVEGIATGFAFTPEANGYSINGDLGRMILLSSSMRYFSSFSYLSIADFEEEVPYQVRINSMRIAIRVLFQTESLDFEMDPRGIIPEEIMKKMEDVYYLQSVFLAGHEYAHFLLGHLKDDNKKEFSYAKRAFHTADDPKRMYEYNVAQKDEFAADLDALSRPNFDDELYSSYYESVMLLFAALTIAESVKEYAFPSSGYQSHPSARARYMHLLAEGKKPKDYDVEEFAKRLPYIMDKLSSIMCEDFALNPDTYEMYGSVYLAAPNTAWRGRELIDRKDY